MDSNTLNSIISSAYKETKNYLNLPSPESLKNIDWSDISSIVTTIGTTLILIGFSAFILWLIRAIGLYKMAIIKGDPLAFTAFIPFGSLFIMGRIIGKSKIFKIDVTYPEYVLPAILLTMKLPYSTALSTILFVAFYYGILYKLYKEKWHGFAAVATIISFFIPILQPFFVFFIRKR